jgi:hypothetical protein
MLASLPWVADKIRAVGARGLVDIAFLMQQVPRLSESS